MAATVSAKARLLAIGLAVAIFGGGAAAGIAIDRLWLASSSTPATHHKPRHGDVIERFRERLDLTDEQVAGITTIVEGLHAEAESLHADLDRNSRAVHDRAREDILQLLTPEQATRYNDMIRKMHGEHHGKHFNRHGPGRDRPPGH